MKERLYDVPVLGGALRVQDRFSEVGGTALANGIALQAFLSIFPLLIVAVAVVGFIAEGDVSFADDLIDTLGLPDGPDTIGDDLRTAIDTARESKGTAGAIGIAGLVYSGLAIVTALQRAVDRTWQTFGKGLKDKARAVLVILGAVVIFVASFALSILINFLPGIFAPVSVLTGLAVNVALFLWLFVALGRLPLGIRARLPGAVLCAVGLEVLKLIGTVYIPRLVANSSALYGSLGVVVAILAWLGFFGRLLVYGSVVNVLAWEREHGTVDVPLQAPRVDSALAAAANRAGQVTDRLEPLDPAEAPPAVLPGETTTAVGAGNR